MNENKNLNSHMVYSTIIRFLNVYIEKKDVESTLSFLSEQIVRVGPWESEIAVGKEEFRKFMEKEIFVFPGQARYEISNYIENRRMQKVWDCYFKMIVIVMSEEGTQTRYPMRVTAGLHYEGEKHIFDIIHISEVGARQETGEIFPMEYVSNGLETINMKTKKDLLEIVRQVIPGGVIGGYEEEGYPLYAANEHFLKMAGYGSCKEFKKDIDGLIINSIHPDDRLYVTETVQHNFEYQDQYEVQYRMKKKDGTYIWVHDIGKRTVDAKGRSAIISVITDISEQIMRKKRIEKELARDILTGLYNRKSGEERISKKLAEPCEYMFFMLDLDNFKRINDIYGHVKGDEILVSFAKLAKETFQDADTVCRMGGDEFIVFISGTSDVQAVMKKLRTLMEKYRITTEEICPKANASISVGGVYSDKTHSFKELYKLSDEVLYEVKEEKKGEIKIRKI